MSDWKTEKLSDLVDSKRGISYGVVQPGYPIPDGIPILRVNNIKNGQILINDVLRISSEIESKHSRTRLVGGEVLMTIVGTVGDTAIATEREAGWNVARAVAVIPPQPGVSSKWIQLCLQSPTVREAIFNRVTTTVQTTLNLRDISELKIPMPSEKERNAITAVLGALDDKIELNRRMNTTLEAMARALFKSWFVDFDPVRAKMEGKQPFGMDAATAALFPSRLVPSPLGDIPEGWNIGTIRDFCKRVESGGTPSRNQTAYWDKGTIPWLTSGEVRQKIVLDTKEKITQSGLDGSNAKIWPSLTTVVAMYGATAGQVTLLGKQMSANQACCALIPKDSTASFVFLKTSQSVSEYEGQATGSAQQNLNQSIVANLPSVVPQSKVLEIFETMISPYIRSMIQNTNEIEYIEKIRDYLLPKLISGDIRIPDAEKFLEAA